jgi:hypothetical protein
MRYYQVALLAFRPVAAVDAARGACCKTRDVLPYAASGFGRAELKDTFCRSPGRDVRLKTAV